MSLSSVLKPVNDLTRQYLKLQSILKPEEITRKRLEIGVQGETILLNAYEKLDDEIQSFKDFRRNYLTQKEAFNQELAKNISTRKKESTEILNNSKDIIKPNASQYLQDNILEDKIELFDQRKQELEKNLSCVEFIKNNMELFDLKLTPIHKEIFAEEIKEFEQGIKAAIKQIDKFEDELKQELENLKKNLEDLQQNYRNNGYGRTSLKNQVWIDDFINNNGHNKAHENQN